MRVQLIQFSSQYKHAEVCISDTQNALLYSTGVTYVIEPPMTTTEQNFTKDMDKSHANRILCFKISSLEKEAPKIKDQPHDEQF